jgi:hypothetical protein
LVATSQPVSVAQSSLVWHGWPSAVTVSHVPLLLQTYSGSAQSDHPAQAAPRWPRGLHMP